MEDNIKNNDMDNQVLGLVKAVPNVIGQVYQDIAQPSVQAVGKALGTVFEFSTSFLLPVKLLNEKFKLNFTKRLDEYKKKLEEIPEEKRCEVHPQIGTPIIEKLTYTTTDEIADLFTTLLANASNKDTVNKAHPSFVSMIERLSPDEAKILNFIKEEDYIPYTEIRAEKDGDYEILESHLTTLKYDLDLMFPQNIGAYLSNFISLGIIVGNRDAWIQLTAEEEYARMCNNFRLDELKSELVPNKYSDIIARRDFFIVTPIGKLFIDACISKSK